MTTVLQAYDRAVASAQLRDDPHQRPILMHLDLVSDALNKRQNLNAVTRFFHSKPRGLYIWGGVGRGKTMLMDMFYHSLIHKKKRRVHFHAFMQDVHARIFEIRQTQPRADALLAVADGLAAETDMLCFDEMVVTDVADAMILSRLFTRLFDRGVTVVSTSNIAPDNLYQDGLNRALFMPFIVLLKKHTHIVHMPDGHDYRLAQLRESGVWFEGKDKTLSLVAAFSALTSGHDVVSETLALNGRKLFVPQTANGTAYFTFSQLCDAPLGTEDYLELAAHYHTLFVSDIPRFTVEQRNPLRRFINLIDILYDAGVNLVASAAAAPHLLIVDMDGYENFGFERTASRLIEMRADDYLSRR